METETSSVIRFVRMVDTAPLPQRADRAAGGTLPTRAFRYCEAVTTASALGWYVFAPTPFRLLWTGTETLWSCPGSADWQPLGAAQFSGFKDKFNQAAPPAAREYSPSFLGALAEPGIVQVWSGFIAQTRADWSIIVRPPINLPRQTGYDVLEGIIESDQWFGPLFVNIRLTRTDTVIDFHPRVPLFQVQPIQRATYSEDTLSKVAISELSDLVDQDWQAYSRAVVEPAQSRCPHGGYAKRVRKRRQLEFKSRQQALALPRNALDPLDVGKVQSPEIVVS